MQDFQDNGHRECDICFEKVAQKKVLGCGHDFCQLCLEKLYSDALRENQQAWEVGILCPECRQETMIQTKNGLEALPTRFFGLLKCGYCQAQKATDEMWWCPVCVKILCSKCDVKEHRASRHEVFEWNSLRGVSDCIYFMTKHRKLEKDLKDYFAKVTSEILAKVNAQSSEKSELATILASSYRISDNFPDPVIVHDSDKSHEISGVVQQAFSLAEINVPAESAAPSDGEKKIKELISQLSPQSVAESLLTGSLKISPAPSSTYPAPSYAEDVRSSLARQPIRRWESDVSPEPSAPPPIGDENISSDWQTDDFLDAPTASGTLYPTLGSRGEGSRPMPSAPPSPTEQRERAVQIAGMSLRQSFPLTNIPSDFLGICTNIAGTSLALFGRNEILIGDRTRNNWNAFDPIRIRSGIIDVCYTPITDEIYVLSYSGAASMAFVGYHKAGDRYKEFYKDVLELDSDCDTKICSVPGGTAVYIAQQKQVCDNQTVIYKYSTGGLAGALSWLQKFLLYPVAKRSDNDYGEEFGELLTIAAVRTPGEHYTDVIAVGFEHGVSLFQISDIRVQMNREDVQMPSAVRSVYFGTIERDSVQLRFRNDVDIDEWTLNFEREMTRAPQGQSQKLNRLKMKRGHERAMEFLVTFNSDDFRNSLLCGDSNPSLELLRLDLRRKYLETYTGDGSVHNDYRANPVYDSEPGCSIM